MGVLRGIVNELLVEWRCNPVASPFLFLDRLRLPKNKIQA